MTSKKIAQHQQFTWDARASWTWEDVALAAIAELAPDGTPLPALYAFAESCPKALHRAHWKARLRATLEGSASFVRVEEGVWALASRFSAAEVERLNELRRARHPLLGPRVRTGST
jgi:hypothetical protein